MCKNILIVDDDFNFISNIVNTIKNKDCSISIANSISRAEEIISDDRFDVVIANVKVPGGNSIALKKSTLNKTKFFFMSDLDDDYRYIMAHGEEFFYKRDFSLNFNKVV